MLKELLTNLAQVWSKRIQLKIQEISKTQNPAQKFRMQKVKKIREKSEQDMNKSEKKQ